MKRYLKYGFIFLFCLINTLFCSYITNDEIWSFGFAYNISQGLIPYRDFNMIVTPFFCLLYGAFMHIFGNSMLSFHCLQAIICTFGMYFAFQLCEKRAWLLFLCLFVPINLLALLPSYNTLLFFLLIIILYLEKEKKANFTIGILLAFAILTKQTTGCLIALVGILTSYKKKRHFIQRSIGIFSVLLAFLFYLLLTHSFFAFFDQCLLGLFDFARENSNRTLYSILLSISLWGLIFFKKYKHPSSKAPDYILAFSTILLPLFDFAHILLVGTSVLFLYLLDAKAFPKFINHTIIFGLIYALCMIFLQCYQEKSIYPNDLDPFSYRYLSKNTQQGYQWMKAIHQKYKKYDSYFLSREGYSYKLVNQLPIGQLDLINRGNHGYHGTEKILNYIKKTENNSIYIITQSDLKKDKANQIDQEIILYITTNFRKLESIGTLDIYQYKKSKT